MKVKIFFIVLVSLLLAISVLQIFSVPPYGDDVFPVYKSGYFNELDSGFKIITESFIGIKTLGTPVYAWIFLRDLKEKAGIEVKVYDYRGYLIPAPGEKEKERSDEVQRIINSLNPVMKTAVKNRRYTALIPLKSEKKCTFCHEKKNRRGIIGAMTFERNFSSHIYYTSERILIFTLISLLLSGILFLLLRWDPGKNIKELFDKS